MTKNDKSSGPVSPEQMQDDMRRLLADNHGGVSETDAIAFGDWIEKTTIDATLLAMFRSGTIRVVFKDGVPVFVAR